MNEHSAPPPDRTAVQAIVATKITEVVHAARANFGPLYVILFGSRARGDGQLYANIDLYVILSVNEDRADSLASASRWYDSVHRWALQTVNVHLGLPPQPNAYGSVVGSIDRWALLEGMIVYDQSEASIRWPDHTVPAQSLLPPVTDSLEERQAVTAYWLDRARQATECMVAEPSRDGQDRRYRCEDARTAAHAALIAVAAWMQHACPGDQTSAPYSLRLRKAARASSALSCPTWASSHAGLRHP